MFFTPEISSNDSAFQFDCLSRDGCLGAHDGNHMQGILYRGDCKTIEAAHTDLVRSSLVSRLCRMGVLYGCDILEMKANHPVFVAGGE